MATPLPCDNHPDRLAVILTTNLEAGETLTMCWDCTVQWAQMVAGVADVAEATEDEPVAAPEEVADLEPVVPVPDAGLKSEPEPATPPAQDEEHRAEAVQEATAPGE